MVTTRLTRPNRGHGMRRPIEDFPPWTREIHVPWRLPRAGSETDDFDLISRSRNHLAAWLACQELQNSI